jgi:hypothetical protein
MIQKLLNFNQLILISQKRKSMSYYYKIRNRRDCFKFDIDKNVKNANKLIDSTLNDSTAHAYVSAFV